MSEELSLAQMIELLLERMRKTSEYVEEGGKARMPAMGRPTKPHVSTDFLLKIDDILERVAAGEISPADWQPF